MDVYVSASSYSLIYTHAPSYNFFFLPLGSFHENQISDSDYVFKAICAQSASVLNIWLYVFMCFESEYS